MPIYIADYALSAVAREDETLENTIWCIEDHVTWEASRNKPCPGIRALLETVRRPVSATDLVAWTATQDRAARVAQFLSNSDLLARAQQAPNAPAPLQKVTTRAHIRNPYVRAYTLRRAKGRCGACEHPAPFQRDDDTPYLEVHHKIPLAEDGPDTIENTLALCPNCHREAHHGANRARFLAL